MQPQSPSLPAGRTKALRLAGAAILATFGVWLAYQRVSSWGEPPDRSAAFKGKTRGETPAFWLRDHASGRELAQQTGKPIFLVIRCEP
jgi:hypothetical protein